MMTDQPKDSQHHLVPESKMVAQLDKEGFTEQFIMTDDGMKDTDGNLMNPEEMKVVKEFRFEGESNPDDMSILYAVETGTGKKGTITNAYGTYADTRINDFIEKIEKSGGKK